MPKPVIHHSHIAGAAPISFLLKLTGYDFVYYSEQENRFHVSQNGCTKKTYVKCIHLRSYQQDFDGYLQEKLLFKQTCNEPHNNWKAFRELYKVTAPLYYYYLFFEKILFKVCD